MGKVAGKAKPPKKYIRRKKPKPVDIEAFCDLIVVKSHTLEEPIGLPESKAGNRNFAYLTGHAMRLVLAKMIGKLLHTDINKLRPAELKDLTSAMKMCNEICNNAMDEVNQNEVGGIMVKQGSIMQGLVSHMNKIVLVSKEKEVTQDTFDEGMESMGKLKKEAEKIIEAKTVDLSDALRSDPPD